MNTRPSQPERPQLWMVWRPLKRKRPISLRLARGYCIRTYRPGDEAAFLELMASGDFDPWDRQKLAYNVSKILPQGWFFALQEETKSIVGTAMCLHNYYGRTPFVGDVGWLACHPAHRGKGLGYSLTAQVTNRFCDAGYSEIQLHTEYYRLPAIKTYLKLGYIPRMFCPEMYPLWEGICATIKWPFTPNEWMQREGPMEIAKANHQYR